MTREELQEKRRQALSKAAEQIDEGTRRLRAQMKVDAINDAEGQAPADGYTCDKCHNKQYYLTLNDQLEEVYHDCECKQVHRARRLLQESGLGSFTEKTLDNFTTGTDWQRTLKENAQRFTESESRLFFIGGQSGAGKTHLCAGIAHRLAEKGKSIRYIVWPEEYARAAQNPEYKEELFKKIESADVVYVDDLFKPVYDEYHGGQSDPTKAEIALFFTILNKVYNSTGQQIIISTERYIDDIGRYDQATEGRVKQMSGNVYITHVKPDESKDQRRYMVAG